MCTIQRVRLLSISSGALLLAFLMQACGGHHAVMPPGAAERSAAPSKPHGRIRPMAANTSTFLTNTFLDAGPGDYRAGGEDPTAITLGINDATQLYAQLNLTAQVWNAYTLQPGTWTTLGASSGLHSFPTGMSNPAALGAAGVVVGGVSGATAADLKAFLWSNGTMHTLPKPTAQCMISGCPSSYGYYADGIDDAGDVAGTFGFTDTFGTLYAVEWRSGGQPTYPFGAVCNAEHCPFSWANAIAYAGKKYGAFIVGEHGEHGSFRAGYAYNDISGNTTTIPFEPTGVKLVGPALQMFGNSGYDSPWFTAIVDPATSALLGSLQVCPSNCFILGMNKYGMLVGNDENGRPTLWRPTYSRFGSVPSGYTKEILSSYTPSAGAFKMRSA